MIYKIVTYIVNVVLFNSGRGTYFCLENLNVVKLHNYFNNQVKFNFIFKIIGLNMVITGLFFGLLF